MSTVAWSILCLISVQSAVLATAHRLPLIVATTAEPSALEKELPDAWLKEDWLKVNQPSLPRVKADDVLKEALDAKYILKEFSTFRLLYHPNTFRLSDTLRQSAVLEKCLQLVSEGKEPITLEMLSPEEARTVRGMFPVLPLPDGEILPASMPNLKLIPGLMTHMDLELGGKSAQLILPPRTPLMSELDSFGTSMERDENRIPIPAEDRAKPVPSSFTLLFPTDHPSAIERLGWTEQIQAYFKQECILARLRFEHTNRRLLSILKSKEPSRYNDQVEGMPRFSDFSAEEQHSLGQMFRAGNRGLFGDPVHANAFLRNAQTKSFQSDFVLTISFVEGRTANSASVRNFHAVFRCPIGP